MNARAIATAAAAIAAMGLFAALLGRFWFVCDDAYISFAYADNLARGNGLVWHPDTAAVEGFSNPLWTLVLALGCWLSLDPTIVAPSLSAACGAALLLWVGRLSLLLAGPIAHFFIADPEVALLGARVLRWFAVAQFVLKLGHNAVKYREQHT